MEKHYKKPKMLPHLGMLQNLNSLPDDVSTGLLVVTQRSERCSVPEYIAEKTKTIRMKP